MDATRRSLLQFIAAMATSAPIAACASTQGQSANGGYPRVTAGGEFADIGFATWTDAEPDYQLYPGDEISVLTPTAPELNRDIRLGPDGRISLPLVGEFMAGDKGLHQLEGELSQAYASQLLRPTVEVVLRQAGPLKVWVAGEVRTPGVYDMPGDIDAYQAIVMAGDFLPTGRKEQVALIRRGPGGLRMMRVLDLRPRRAEIVAVRRGDVLYVPRNTLAEVAFFFSQIRDALPVGFNYTLNGQYQQF